MLCQALRSLAVATVLICSLPLLAATRADPPPQSGETGPERSEETVRHAKEAQDEEAPEQDPAVEPRQKQDQQPRREQPPACPPPACEPFPGAPFGRWVQKELTFRMPIIVPEGFPLPDMPVPGPVPMPKLPAFPAPHQFAPPPAPFQFPAMPQSPGMPSWKLTPAEPDPGSLRVDEHVETDSWGHQWLVRRKTWTSRGAVCSELSRVPYVARPQPREEEGETPDGVAPAPLDESSSSESPEAKDGPDAKDVPDTTDEALGEPTAKLRPLSRGVEASVTAVPHARDASRGSSGVAVGASVTGDGRSRIYVQRSPVQPPPPGIAPAPEKPRR